MYPLLTDVKSYHVTGQSLIEYLCSYCWSVLDVFCDQRKTAWIWRWSWTHTLAWLTHAGPHTENPAPSTATPSAPTRTMVTHTHLCTHTHTHTHSSYLHTTYSADIHTNPLLCHGFDKVLWNGGVSQSGELVFFWLLIGQRYQCVKHTLHTVIGPCLPAALSYRESSRGVWEASVKGVFTHFQT